MMMDSYNVDICLLSFPDIIIYAEESSYYDMPAELTND